MSSCGKPMQQARETYRNDAKKKLNVIARVDCYDIAHLKCAVSGRAKHITRAMVG